MDEEKNSSPFSLMGLNLWDDNPATKDLLGISSIANSIKDALAIENLDPLTVGIHSPWGGGKTTALGLLEEELSEHDEYIIIRTNPWEYDNHDDVKALLIAEIIDRLQEKFKEDANIQDKAKDLIKRISWSRVSAMVAKGAITMQWKPDEIVDAFTPKSRDTPESMSGFRDAFAEFLELLEGKKRVIILVDDLDRCLPDAVMSTLEAVKLFLSVKKMAFVLAADQDMVRDAIAASLHASGRSEIFATRYLEKIVQLPVSLPRLSTEDAATYIALLFAGYAAPTVEDFDNLVDHCHKRRQSGKSPVMAELSGLGWKPEDSIIEVADRIALGLSAEKTSNPRHVKRFLNLLAIRMQVAQTNGIEIDARVVAKLFILEDRLPKDFERLVGMSAEDRKTAIENWESTDKKESEEADAQSNEELYAWASAEPQLSSVNIDQYLAFAASFANIAVGSNLDDEQVQIISGLSSNTETIRQKAVQNFNTKSSPDQNKIINGLFGTVARLDSVETMVKSLVEIAKENADHATLITSGIKEYCWHKIDPATALIIAISEVPEIKNLSEKLTDDSDIKDDVKFAIQDVG